MFRKAGKEPARRFAMSEREEWKDLTVEDVLRLVEHLGGVERVLAMLEELKFVKRARPLAKYGKRTLGQVEAIENFLGSDMINELLAGKMKLAHYGQNEGGSLTCGVRAVERGLFDKNGRRIPPQGLVANVCDANYLYAPTKLDKVSYAVRLERLNTAFGEEVVLPTPDEFVQRITALVEKIEADDTSRNVLYGAWYPVCIPGGLGITLENYGEKVDTKIVPAVGAAYKRAFPKRTFFNNMVGQRACEVKIWNGSRHERLIEAASKGPVVGICFPTALQGYSVNADREQMASLPEMFWLAGALDTLVAQIMYAQELLRDGKAPYYDMAANTWRGWPLCDWARDDYADFSCGNSLVHARSDCAGGLFLAA
jgi:hypothetical protein